MLGALATAVEPAGSTVTAGLDFVVLAAPVTSVIIAAKPVPVLVLVSSADEVAPALQAGACEALSVSPITGATLLDGDRARLVTSVDAARAAFVAGFELVIYDIPAMLGELFDSLTPARPVATDAGGREPLVLLSGMLGDRSLWDGLSAHLNDVVLPWPARIDLDDSVPEMAATVLAQAPPRFALAGHSLGAIVALEILRQAPSRVSRVMLVNASGRGPSEAQRDAWRSWRERTVGGQFERIAQELALDTLPAARRADTHLVRASAAMAFEVGADGFLRQLSAQMSRPDSLASLANITVPVLVVSGALDAVCPAALQQEIVDHCPTAELSSIADAGHMVPLEAPAELAARVRSWLGSDMADSALNPTPAQNV